MSLAPEKSPPIITPHMIHTYSRYGVVAALRTAGSSASAAAITWVANSAVYHPIYLPFPYLVRRLMWLNGGTITSTNADVGIYDFAGNKIVSAGPTAMSAVYTPQFVSLSSPILLPPGSYYVGWWCNNTTNRAYGFATSANYGRMGGALSQASLASGLPNTFTPAAYAPLGLVVAGFTRTDSGF